LHPTDRPTVHLLLGLIALRGKLRVHLDEAASQPRATAILTSTAVTSTTGTRARDLLR
jgi:hypothetical protein